MVETTFLLRPHCWLAMTYFTGFTQNSESCPFRELQPLLASLLRRRQPTRRSNYMYKLDGHFAVDRPYGSSLTRQVSLCQSLMTYTKLTSARRRARVAAPRGGYTVHDLRSIAVAVYIASFYTYAWFPVRGQKQDDWALFKPLIA